MVTFSNRGYADVWRTEERQRRIVERALIGVAAGVAVGVGVGVRMIWRRR